MTFDDRVQVVAKKGFTDRQGRFLVTVMLHAGVCVPRQYARFCGIVHGHRVWKQDGEPALASSVSRAITDAVEAGAGRVEVLELCHRYGHLSPGYGRLTINPTAAAFPSCCVTLPT
jgi:hypothetical protein